MNISGKISIFSEAYSKDPYKFFPYFRTQEPVFYEESIDCYFVSNYEDVKYVLENEEIFTTKTLAKRAQPVMRDRVLAQMTGKEHKEKKKMIMKGLTGENLKRLLSLFKQNAIEVLKPYLNRGKIDLVNDFGKIFAVQSTMDMLGLDKKDQEQIAEWHKGIAKFITSFNLSDEEIEYCFWCSEQLEKYLLPIIESKKDSSGNDLISILQRSEFNGIKMTSQEILALTLNILLAATEPVDKTLALLFYNLLQNPKQFEDVKNNRKLLKNAINETLRFKPPVQFIPRQVSREVTIKGVLIPKNAVIINMIGAANRDPKAFSNPDKFDIYRSIEDNKAFTSHSQNLAFGYGTHTCVGASLALMQLELVANIILDSFKNIELDESFSYEEKGLYTRGPVSLVLKFTT